MHTILLSAFKAFGGYPQNSSHEVALQLQGRMIDGYQIETIIFDCEIPRKDRGAILGKYADSLNAAAIISLGMTSSAQRLRVEAVAHNVIDCEKYCPKLGRRAIDQDVSLAEARKLDLHPWQIGDFVEECADEDIPVEVSDNAGGFCCNHLMWQVYSRRRIDTMFSFKPFVFIHLPCHPEAVADPDAHKDSGKTTMPLKKMIRGVEILIHNAILPL